MLREHGYPEWFVRAVLSHGDHPESPRSRSSSRRSSPATSSSGFVHACGLVRPEGLSTLDRKSVQEEAEAAGVRRGVNRDDVTEGAEGSASISTSTSRS